MAQVTEGQIQMWTIGLVLEKAMAQLSTKRRSERVGVFFLYKQLRNIVIGHDKHKADEKEKPAGIEPQR